MSRDSPLPAPAGVRKAEGLGRHCIAGPRGQASDGGRYGNLFPGAPACEVDDAVLVELAAAMAALPRSTDNFDIPAGYTYLGQFADHDLTFDTGSRLRRDNAPET